MTPPQIVHSRRFHPFGDIKTGISSSEAISTGISKIPTFSINMLILSAANE